MQTQATLDGAKKHASECHDQRRCTVVFFISQLLVNTEAERDGQRRVESSKPRRVQLAHQIERETSGYKHAKLHEASSQHKKSTRYRQIKNIVVPENHYATNS